MAGVWAAVPIRPRSWSEHNGWQDVQEIGKKRKESRRQAGRCEADPPPRDAPVPFTQEATKIEGSADRARPQALIRKFSKQLKK